MADKGATKESIRHFLSKIAHNSKIKDDDDIFALGLLNSMFAMELVLFIEKTFSIKITNDDLSQSNFHTIQAIDSFITRKQQATTNHDHSTH